MSDYRTTNSSGTALRLETEARSPQTDIPRVLAGGDVRSGSIKRCTTAVGEGAMAVRCVHAHVARPTVQEMR
jgi:thioredoxin reductase (NADPH)